MFNTFRDFVKNYCSLLIFLILPQTSENFATDCCHSDFLLQLLHLQRRDMSTSIILSSINITQSKFLALEGTLNRSKDDPSIRKMFASFY